MTYIKEDIMRETKVTMSKLRQNLGNLVNRAAYGSERIIPIAHGELKAATVRFEDLHRLQQLDNNQFPLSNQYSSVLAEADILREEIRQWQEAHGIEPEDSVDMLNQLRAEHNDELLGLG